MAQISYAYNGLFPRNVEIPESALTIKELKRINPDHILQMFMYKFKPSSLVPTKINVFDTTYKPGMVLVLGKEDYGEVMQVGLLEAIIVEKDQVYFGCLCFDAQQTDHGYYVTQKLTGSPELNLEIRSLSELADPHPLQRIGSADAFYFCLHHYISSTVQRDQE